MLAGYGIAVPVGAVATYLVSLTARTSLRTGASAALGVATADGLYALVAALGGAALAAALRPALGPLRWASALLLLVLAARSAVMAVRQYRARRLTTRTDPPPPRPCRHIPVVRPEGGPRGVRCVLSACRAQALVLVVRGSVPGAARVRAWRRGAGGNVTTGPSPARAYLALLGITLLNPTTMIYFAALVLGTRTADAVRPLEQGVFVVAAFLASASWQLLLAGGGALLGRALTGRRGRLVTAVVSSGVITLLAVRMMLPG
nr:LysE family transporter [Streptomyces sp. S3(2020)]